MTMFLSISPPVIPVSDAVVLSTIVDGLIFVVPRADDAETDRQDALAQLGNRQSKILGLVLNRVNMKSGEYRNIIIITIREIIFPRRDSCKGTNPKSKSETNFK